MRYEFIKMHKKVYPVTFMCGIFRVSSSGFYDWLQRDFSQNRLANDNLDCNIINIYEQHKKRYGSPRIHKELVESGKVLSRQRVARRMQRLGLRAVQSRKFKVTTDSNHDKPVAKNLLQQDFHANHPNQKWVADITYIPTKEGWLYLSVVMDLYSRAVIGWSMGKYIDKQLVCSALTMALFRRKFPKGVIVHSDRGSQYCSTQYQNMLLNNALKCSMSGKGCCYDNAAMESFFHSLKVELVHRINYKTRMEAKNDIFQYIETYYNLKRRHSANDFQAPFVFEKMNQNVLSKLSEKM
ncbi:MAG: IS3 family transposase [Rickettsiales bacterium]